MKRFAIDYAGWFYLDADSESEATSKAHQLLTAARLFEQFDGDWEMVNIVEVVAD